MLTFTSMGFLQPSCVSVFPGFSFCEGCDGLEELLLARFFRKERMGGQPTTGEEGGALRTRMIAGQRREPEKKSNFN